MQGIGSRSWVAGIALVLSLVIAGCAASRGPAPIEDRGTMSKAPSATPATPGGPLITTDANGKPLAGIENYGKPGYYAVRPGDTIRRIGTETGQRWQDIAKWNNVDNPDLIEVGQVLRVIPPGSTAVAGASASTDVSGVVTRPVVTQATIGGPSAATATGTATPPGATTPAPGQASAAVTPTKPPVTTSSVAPAAAASGDEDVGWIWPAQGSLIAGFDKPRTRGSTSAARWASPSLLRLTDAWSMRVPACAATATSSS